MKRYFPETLKKCECTCPQCGTLNKLQVRRGYFERLRIPCKNCGYMIAVENRNMR